VNSEVEPIVGVQDGRRLEEIARLDLHGQVSDPGLDAAVETVTVALSVPMAAVNVVTPDLQTYAAEVGIGVPCTTVPDDLSFCAEVVDTGSPLVVTDALAHPVYRNNPLVRQGSIRAYAGFPLMHRGAVIGSVCAFASEPRSFSSEELLILAAQARLASSMLSLRHSATHDSLTGLANRARGAEFARQSLANPPASVLFIDIDDFKTVNDTHGHEAGDDALRLLARRLETVLSGTSYLPVRWGGDEFLVLMPGTREDEARDLADRIVRAAAEDRAASAVGLTIGYATTDTAADLDELVRLASAGAAEGKRGGKGQARAGVDASLPSSVRRRSR
jgi:diguanylate cyclase (GGDEF)-like protein